MKLQDKRILMFEDNLENIQVQQALLEEEGAYVDLFFGEMISGLKQKLPLDLIIMDLMIAGGVDGFDYRKMLSQEPALADIPVVAVSAMDASLAVSKAKSLGFAGFIAKPIDMDRFANQIALIIDGKAVWDTNRR